MAQDIANLVLAVDSTQVKTGTAALDGLTAAGARAEAASVCVGAGLKGAGAEASAMAAAAQLSARAAMDQAAGFTAATSAARVNTIAMRETLVVARELSRGNFTRIPGSLSLLAQGVGSQGGIGAFASSLAQMLGLIKTVQNAELAEAAAAAAAATAGVEAAARRAAANVMSADTELALAEAQLRVTEGTSAEAVAQVRLAAAHDAVGAAAAEAAVAEDALASSMTRSSEASAASAAATRTVIGGAGIGLIGLGLVAGVAYGAIKELQDQIKDSGSLDTFAESLNLTDAQIKKLGGSITYLGDGTREISGLTVSMGDVMAGVWEQVTANSTGAFGDMQNAAHSAFSGILGVWNQTSAAITAGLWTLGNIAVDVFQYIGQQIGQSFYNGVNSAIDAINSLNAKIPKALGGGDANLIPHIGQDKRVSTAGGLLSTIQRQADQNYRDALAQNQRAFQGVATGAVQHARNRLQTLSNQNKPKKAKKPKKKSDHGLADALAKLDAETKGQLALADAYLQSDAAAQRATALQKAEEDAIQHKSTAGVFYEKELQKAVAESIAQSAKKVASLNDENAAHAKVNAMVAAGLIPASQANSAYQLQLDLQKQDQNLVNADAAAREKGLKVRQQTIDATEEQIRLAAQAQAQQQIASNDNEIERLQLENSLMGQSNAERAVALAQLEEMQKLRGTGTPQGEADRLIQQAGQLALLKTQNPFQQWAKDIPQTSAAINESLQSIETKGLDSLAQAIAGVVTGTESLGKAFKDVATQIISDLVQMTVKMLLFRALSSVFGGLFGGGGFGTSSLSSLGNLSSVQAFNGPLPGFASGGSMIIGGNGGVDNNVLSLNGSPIAMVGQGETLSVYPNRPSAANSNNAPQVIEVRVATDENFSANVQQIVGATVVQAVPVIISKATTQTIRTLQRPAISGGR